MQSVAITKSSNRVDGEVYSIHHYVIQLVSHLWNVNGILRRLRFPPSIQLTATLKKWNVIESGMKHQTHLKARWAKNVLKVKGHYGMRHTALWSCTHIPNKYYLKNNYLTLRSKIKVPRRSLRYVTHHLMIMHPHTKYHWPISKDKNAMAQTR
jgi:hypothetical protein